FDLYDHAHGQASSCAITGAPWSARASSCCGTGRTLRTRWPNSKNPTSTARPCSNAPPRHDVRQAYVYVKNILPPGMVEAAAAPMVLQHTLRYTTARME